MNDLAGRRAPDGAAGRHTVIHLTTTDISLELLLGPQLQAFTEAGYDVVAMSAPGPFVPSIEGRGVRFVPLEHSTRAMNVRSDLRAIREVYRHFRTLRPTIVHTHNPKPGVYGRMAARAARVPVVVNTVHGLYAQPGDPWRRRAAVYGLERIAATCSDAELVQNPEDIDTLRRLRVSATKLAVLGNGIDLGRFRGPGDDPNDDRRKRVRRELGIAEDAVVVGVVGRLVYEKGYREVFEAARIVRDRYASSGGTDAAPAPVFVVIGPHEPDKADAVDDLTLARARQDGVILCGHRNDVEDLYAAMDVYVLASYREGFPRSAMEAAASGLPIVATDIRGCRQVVEHERTGLLVPARDGAALADAIARITFDAPLRSQMAAAALGKAHAEFDQQHQIDLTLATYARLIKAAGLAS